LYFVGFFIRRCKKPHKKNHKKTKKKWGGGGGGGGGGRQGEKEVKKNKREISPEFLPTKARQPGESMFGFQKDKVLVSFVPKRNKAVIQVSSMHDFGVMDEATKRPEIIPDYNMTKGGVDT
jgi:hypothetical protein